MTPVIMCGGQGTRLWPLSRTTFPKPFCELLQRSLIEETISRLKHFGSPWMITVEDLKGLSIQTFRRHGISQNQLIFEPMGRNTAPAVALLCQILILKNRSKEIVGIFPADHLIENQNEFRKAIELAEACARDGQVCTLGIIPSFAATGFGYIEVKKEKYLEKNGISAFGTLAFHEKPDIDAAKTYLESRRFFWNAGIFIFQASVMAENFKKLMPNLWNTISTLKSDLSNLSDVYARAEAKSIDYGIMEHLKEQVCIPCDIGWSDVGTWDEISKISDIKKSAEIFSEGSKDNFVFSMTKKVVGLIDVENLIVVDSPDALLISKRGHSQKVGALQKKIAEKNKTVTHQHASAVRPWGKYEILSDGTDFKAKVIHVDPGQKFSYQSHSKRSEHWVVVKGNPIVTLNGKDKKLSPGEYIFIPVGAKHRMRNDGDTSVQFIEVQVGSYFGEDDIIRYEDDYGRTKKP